jgi:uncharacterized LabA/DUF88 family protein
MSNAITMENNGIMSSTPLRCSVYIDGFNLYFGLREAKFQKYYWLDLGAFARSLCNTDQQVVSNKYFTSRISGAQPGDSRSQIAKRNGKRLRQKTYLNALQATGGVQIIEGKFYASAANCQFCKKGWTDYQEKMTDVNIATALLVDAYENKFDIAFVVSGDSDLSPPVEAVVRLFPHKKVIVWFPPNRVSAQLSKVASNSLHITVQHLKHQLPNPININGHNVSRPLEWQ